MKHSAISADSAAAAYTDLDARQLDFSMENNENNLNGFDKTAYKNAQLKSAQTLTTIAIISGPVSLIIGGVFLSLVALVCALIAFSKIRNVIEPSDGPGTYPRMLKNQIIFALSISIVALVLNIVSLIMVFPILIEYMRTGDLTQAMNALNLNIDTASESNSVWG